MRLWLMKLFSALQDPDEVKYPSLTLPIVLVFLKSVGVFGFKKNTNVYKVKYYVLVSLVTNVHTHAFVFLFFYKVNIGMFYICWPAS